MKLAKSFLCESGVRNLLLGLLLSPCIEYMGICVRVYSGYVLLSVFAGIFRPLNVLASSTYRNCARNACLNSSLCTIHFRYIQTLVVSSAPRLVTSVGHLAYGHTTTVLNR